MYFRFIFFFFILFNSSIKANEVKIIELHSSKSLDQIVLEKEDDSDENNTNEESIDQKDNKDDISNNNTSSDVQSENEVFNENDESLVKEDNSENNNDQKVTFLKSETIFDIEEEIINQYLENIKTIKSKTIHREFVKILSNLELEGQQNIDNKVYVIIKKLYEMGEIGKAYNLVKKLNLNNISKQENLDFFYFIELNYLYSTFKLSEVCELKSLLLNESIKLPNYLLEKSDIFCLTLENKYAEAKLLNSLLLESEKSTDQNFQNLFNYMILNEKDVKSFDPLSEIKSKELIFLYSAMLRINELALDKDFIEVDPLNLLIPVILSESTDMDVRIKAANNAYFDEVLSINSLSALYQSVDFNSKQFNNPKETIVSLNNNKELIMAFYYQLVNIQIFPDERLEVILDYWKFAKISGLQKIAYDITEKTIDTFTPTSENTQYGMEIALAYISNRNFNEALKWINLYENNNLENDKLEYVKFLIEINETDELDTIIKYLSDNYKNFNNLKNQNTLESFEVLIKFLNIEDISPPDLFYKNILDTRPMPSYFLLRDINNNINDVNNLEMFLLSLISINNKNWTELHPEHLKLILVAYNLYDNGFLIKSKILEILNELEIF